MDRARRERVAADQQRVERQRLPQLLVAHEPRHDAIDRSPRLMPGQRGRRARHRSQVERHMAELPVALLVRVPRIIEEPAITRDVAGIELNDLARQQTGRASCRERGWTYV